MKFQKFSGVINTSHAVPWELGKKQERGRKEMSKEIVVEK